MTKEMSHMLNSLQVNNFIVLLSVILLTFGFLREETWIVSLYSINLLSDEFNETFLCLNTTCKMAIKLLLLWRSCCESKTCFYFSQYSLWQKRKHCDQSSYFHDVHKLIFHFTCVNKYCLPSCSENCQILQCISQLLVQCKTYSIIFVIFYVLLLWLESQPATEGWGVKIQKKIQWGPSSSRQGNVTTPDRAPLIKVYSVIPAMCLTALIRKSIRSI